MSASVVEFSSKGRLKEAKFDELQLQCTQIARRWIRSIAGTYIYISDISIYIKDKSTYSRFKYVYVIGFCALPEIW